MIMEIHSSLGVLRCRELEKQAIENSIPEQSMFGAYKDTQATENMADDSLVSTEVATEETTPNNP